jgi:hypothetical protein
MFDIRALALIPTVLLVVSSIVLIPYRHQQADFYSLKTEEMDLLQVSD